MIHVFGNSHVNFFTNGHPAARGGRSNNFATYNLGPTIAYHFYEHHFPKVKRTIPTIDKNDWILLCVGEVDCRLHLPQQAELQQRDVLELTEECVDRLFRCYLELKENGYRCIGWGGHPSTAHPHDMSDMSSPIFGDCQYRNSISLFWADYLERKCKIHRVPFVSIVRDLINSEGMTKMEYFIDYCHLNSSLLLGEVSQLLLKATNE